MFTKRQPKFDLQSNPQQERRDRKGGGLTDSCYYALVIQSKSTTTSFSVNRKVAVRLFARSLPPCIISVIILSTSCRSNFKLRPFQHVSAVKGQKRMEIQKKAFKQIRTELLLHILVMGLNVTRRDDRRLSCPLLAPYC